MNTAQLSALARKKHLIGGETCDARGCRAAGAHPTRILPGAFISGMAGGSSASWLQSPRLPKCVLNGGCADAALESDMIGDLSSEKGSRSLRGIASWSLVGSLQQSQQEQMIWDNKQQIPLLEAWGELRNQLRRWGDA